MTALCGHARSGGFRTRRRPPEARPAAFTAHPAGSTTLALDSRGLGDCPPVALPRAAACMRRASRVIGSCRAYGVLLGVRDGAKRLCPACASPSSVSRRCVPRHRPAGRAQWACGDSIEDGRPTPGCAFGPCRRLHRRRYTRPAGQEPRHIHRIGRRDEHCFIRRIRRIRRTRRLRCKPRPRAGGGPRRAGAVSGRGLPRLRVVPPAGGRAGALRRPPGVLGRAHRDGVEGVRAHLPRARRAVPAAGGDGDVDHVVARLADRLLSARRTCCRWTRRGASAG